MFVKSSIFRLLLLTFLVWGGLFFSSIASTVAIWERSETFAHCFIILPICLYLIKQKWTELNAAEIRSEPMAILLMVPVLAVWLFGSLAQLLVIEQAAAFFMLPVMIWAVMGNRVARILLFTLGFWMFSVPVGEFLIPQLQELTADITVYSLQLTGIPVYREGLYIAIPGGLFEVAVACSGIRYLIASFTLGTLYAYLNYNGYKKRLIFVLFSILLPLLANGIRAYGIVIIAHLSDMKYATGVDHLIYGWLFFGVVILIMFSIGNIWADPVKPFSQEAPAQGPQIPVSKTASVSAGVLMLVVVALGYKYVVTNPVSDFQPQVNRIYQAQGEIQDTSWLPVFHNPSLEASNQGDGIDYYLAYYDANTLEREMINTRNRLFNIEHWTIVSEQDQGLYKTLEIIDSRGTKRLLAYTYATEWVTTHQALKVKLSQAVQAFLGQPQIGFILVVSKQLDEEQQDRESLNRVAAQMLTDGLRDVLNER